MLPCYHRNRFMSGLGTGRGYALDAQQPSGRVFRYFVGAQINFDEPTVQVRLVIKNFGQTPPMTYNNRSIHSAASALVMDRNAITVFPRGVVRGSC